MVWRKTSLKKKRKAIWTVCFYAPISPSFSSAISIKVLHFTRGNWRIQPTQRAWRTKAEENIKENNCKPDKKKEEKNHRWIVEVKNKNKNIQNKKVVKNTISLGHLYGSNHWVWDTVKGKNTVNKESVQMKVCVWSLWWLSRRAVIVSAHME